MTPKELQLLRKIWNDTKVATPKVEEPLEEVTPIELDKATIVAALNRIKERELKNVKGGRKK